MYNVYLCQYHRWKYYLGFVGIFMSLLIFLLNKACIFWKKNFVLCFIALDCNEVLTVWQYATALS